MKVFIDIETIPGPIPPAPESVSVPKNYKDPEKIEAYQKENVDAEWRKEGLISYKGRIVCIGYAIEGADIQVLTGDERVTGDERAMLLNLNKAIQGNSVDWVGHNVKFDMLFIYQRAIKYGVWGLKNKINGDKYKGNLICTMDLFGGKIEWNYRCSLSNMLAFLDIESSKDEMDGAEVFDYWKAGKLDEIYEYCKKDVEKTRQAYYKLTGPNAPML